MYNCANITLIISHFSYFPIYDRNFGKMLHILAISLISFQARILVSHQFGIRA